MNCFKKLILLACVFFLSVSFLTTCGIDEYYYLPQVPEGNIESGNITRGYIVIPSISSDIYYASGYNIYYRIYLSDTVLLSISESEISLINSTLNNDYSALKPITDPTNTTLPTATTFTNRKYYLLEFDSISSTLPTSGGVLNISFPSQHGDSPTAIFTNYGGSETRDINLLRSRNAMLDPDQIFSNTDRLRYTDPDTNLDVQPGVTGADLTYVSMYIVAFGTNPSNFSTIFSKPTHIGIFPFPKN
jgi:hypothetical protein